MTLVITSLTPFGIVMGADTMLTRRIPDTQGRIEYRFLRDYIKLQKIPKLTAGISYWGEGQIDQVSTEIWIRDFIRDHEPEYNTLQEFAILLQNQLRKNINPIIILENAPIYRTGTIGFHLAGYDEFNGDRVPTFWHIHNGISQTKHDIDPRIVNANHDLPPEVIIQFFKQPNIDSIYYAEVSNGDYFPYNIINIYLKGILQSLRQNINIDGNPLVCPNLAKFPNQIEGWAEFIRFRIKLVRDIYSLSNHPQTIGGDVSTLTVTQNEFGTYTTK